MAHRVKRFPTTFYSKIFSINCKCVSAGPILNMYTKQTNMFQLNLLANFQVIGFLFGMFSLSTFSTSVIRCSAETAALKAVMMTLAAGSKVWGLLVMSLS